MADKTVLIPLTGAKNERGLVTMEKVFTGII